MRPLIWFPLARGLLRAATVRECPMARGAPSKAMKPPRALYYCPSICSLAAKIFRRFAGPTFSLRRAALWGRLQPAAGFSQPYCAALVVPSAGFRYFAYHARYRSILSFW